MFTSIQFHITKQATHSYAGYNKNNTLYMVVSEPMYLRVRAHEIPAKYEQKAERQEEQKTKGRDESMKNRCM